MSFAEKIATLMARPGQEQQSPQSDVPWFMRYGAPLLGTVGAFFSVLFGFYDALSIITLNITCVIAGILQIVIGFFILAVEAPCCCFFIEHAKLVATTADTRPLWNRAALYCVLAIVPVILCFGLGSLFPGVLIFGTGAVYGMMSLGKKGTREDMAAAATSPTTMNAGGQMPMSTDQHVTLMEDPDVWRPTASAEEMRNAAINSGIAGVSTTQPTTNDRASIVNNAQPFSFTGAVGTDSNV